MKLLVRNLARCLTEQEIIELFEAHGKVQSCSLVIDPKTNRSKGFGFVEMPNPGEAKAATKSLNGRDIMGLAIRVKRADETGDAADSKEPQQKPEKQDKYKDKAEAAKKNKPVSRPQKQRREPQPSAPAAAKAASEPSIAEQPAAEVLPKPEPAAPRAASVWASAKPKKADHE
jgi:RNA recognition motif-containing protein